MPDTPLKVPAQVLDRFFEEPGGHIVLDSDLRVVEVGPEYLRLTLNSRENLLGKHYINTFAEPDPGRHELATDAVRRLSAAAAKTKQTQKYGPIRIDIQSPEDGRIEERWWQGAYIPVEAGGETFLVHRLEDVTTGKVIERGLRAQRLSNYILYGLVVALLGLGFLLYSQKSDVNRRIASSGKHIALVTCHQVQSINAHLYSAIQLQLKLIEVPGSAVYRFYSQHPDLKAQAKSQSQAELKTFTPKSC